jgi:hypothetical protein
MKIDYTYTHNKSCELMTWLENFLESDKNEAIFTRIHVAMQDVAFHEAERRTPDDLHSEDLC